MRNATFLGAALALIGAAALIVFDLFTYTIDEAFYVAMAERMADAGALSIENGWAEHPVEPMRVRFLREGADGLYPQYPAGYALIAAPFFALFGKDGLLLLQLLAFAACLPLTAALARTLTQTDDRGAFRAAALFGLASFALDYALAIWPHALSTLVALLGWLAAARAVRGAGLAAAALSGLALGLGVTIRADLALAIPPAAAWLLAHPDRPRFALTGFLAGLAPGLALASALNFIKFGALSPISYGAADGGASLSSYAILIPGVVLFAAGALALRNRRALAVAAQPWTPVLLIASLALLSFAPIFGGVVRASLDGLYILYVDIQARLPPEIDSGLLQTSRFYLFDDTLPKTAVAQSMPWALAAAGFAAAALWWRRLAVPRDALVFCLVAICVWSAPFAPSAWHGGLSNSMRYFLPILPLFAILASSLWDAARREAGALAPGGGAVLGAGVFGAVVAVAGVALLDAGIGGPLGAWIQFKASVILAAATACAALLAFLARPEWRPAAARLTLLTLAAGFGYATAATAAGDMRASLSDRALLADASERFRALPKPHLTISDFPHAFSRGFTDPEIRLASRADYDMAVLVDLARRHLAEGWRVYAAPAAVATELAAGSGGALVVAPAEPEFPLVGELIAAPASGCAAPEPLVTAGSIC